MILYRFSPRIFSRDLSGEGARRFGGRWNSKGIPVVYTSSTISLSLLELLIHNSSYDEINTNHLTIIQVPDQVVAIDNAQLKKEWIQDEAYTRFIGDEFLRTRSSLLLKVPSAIITEESNILLNPKHRDFKKVQIQSAKVFHFDSRLFKMAP